ncbi:hypothetical protein Poli38472_010549 [Pythium oligandrum]|uniref:Mitochondrial import inner membrane translocase subunit TIM50 n=1 Tax=Pythium oligandrum TaxID=41045 RepID=A0A8K1FDJ8_PYTOL|nr:hypothetical protein Poli38472_010549 [Pythium oligandrum]|eukprot:TMW55667.1 hypothetical protein Poli38472_010549 [Pythium oligandrum]
MWSRVVRRYAGQRVAMTSATALRRFASDASSVGSVSTVNSASMLAKVGRDVPLKVVPRDARRQARLAERRAGTAGKTTVVRTTSLPTKISLGLLVGSISGSIVWHFVLDDGVKNQIGDTLGATFLGDIYTFFANQIAELAKPYTEPSKEKLLPDWPIPQVPPDTPPVPVLVLDLEDTLVHSEWSRKHGWRHAKRPGVDEFLEALAQYYEIVVFSQNHMYMAEEILVKLDRKQNVLHLLARESTRYFNSAHVKDLSKLNRDLRQVVIIDDDPSAYQLQPDNAIPIKAYTDGRDRGDHELKDLIPFLKALASERVGDFRSVLAEFRDEDGVIRDLPTKYGARVRALEMQKEQEKQKGLGGFIRGRLSTRPSVPGQM